MLLGPTDETPASTKTCIRRWPVSSVAPVKVGQQTQHRGYLSDELAARLSDNFCTELELAISISSLGLEAASLTINIIASGKAAKGAYTEDSLHSAAAFFKECLLNCAIPLFDLPPSNSLVVLVSEKGKPLKNHLHAFFGLILATHDPQDVISLVFASITAMFTTSELAGTSFDKNLLESIRRSAQMLLRHIFEKHIEQRSWILEEILGSLIRLPAQKRSQGSYRIASGKSVQFISILLLKLLQGTAQPPDDLTAGFEGGTLPTKDTDFAIRYLIGRCIRRDNKPALNEADYRNLLESFIDDCVTLLGHPQWPASELVIRIYSMHLIDVLDEEKSDFAMKSLALDGLGPDCSSHRATEGWGLWRLSLRVRQLEAINTFASTTTLLLEYLQSKALSDETTGAIPLYIGGWATTLIAAIIKSRQRKRSSSGDAGGEGMEESPTVSDMTDSDSDGDSVGDGDGGMHRKVVEECLKEYTKITHRSTKAMPSHVSAIFASLPLYRSFDMIVSRMAMSLGSSLVTVRSKALRALNHVASHRPSDNSSLVREAAIDLIGKHVAQNPELTSQYYEFISVRALDKGTSVRKRVMRILRDIYLASDDQTRLVDIGVRVLQRTNDEERTIREFAMKTLQELWFSYNDADAITDDQASLGSSANIFNSLAPGGVMEATRTRELSDLMGTLFEHVTKDVSKAEADAAMFVARCVIDALFEQLLRSEETESASVFSTSACLRFLSALSGIAPEAVGARAEMLSANALHIFQNSSDLIALLSSSPQSILVEAVPCLCMIVEKLTRDYSRIIKLFRSCVLQLYRERRLIESGAAAMQSPKNAMRFMILAGLLCRHFDFDKHRTELETQFKELALLARGMMIPEFMSSPAAVLCSTGLPATVQLAAIQMLGQLYIKRPQLGLQVMRNFLEFLRDDAQRYVQKAKEGKGKGKKKKKVDARALVGNTDDMGEAGVGASLMQTYLERIIRRYVISLVLEQGLAHPLMCVPALIALSTDSDAHIRNKSLKLHQDLAGKHASFIHSRDLEGVRKAFEYQSQVRDGPQYVSGYNDAVEPMDAPGANDFLTMLVNIGDVDGSHLVRFVAENISALDFKYLDEVLLVAYQISSVIAGTGLTVFQLFETEGSEGVNCDSTQWRAATETSVSITILFMLREFLKAHYGVTEARCSGFNPNDTSSSMRDKSVAWHAPTSSQQSSAGCGRIDWSACACATVGLDSPEAYREQRKLFRKMMASSLAVIDELAPMDKNNNSISNGDRSRNDSVPSDVANESFTSDVSLSADVLEQLANEDILD
ncbi:hypothetical protein DL89DRAFT_294691 [Linderina pennispora]|uniref:Sister chromatid cohesion protein n=1 Tax=Linderina pennispora TaxID=61395 RepID=A0A1Y1W2M7_9FUNG|nr:uncharacterized protein DL89DRAFT_294691 [Linderina pennispora]ORX67535.1 hypothetical protein DL89DRAFT_294691 [Linderina pennispora]